MKFLLPFLVLAIVGCTHKDTTHRQPSQVNAGRELPDYAKWVELKDYTSNLDLTDPLVILSPSTGGTSVYAVIKVNGKPIGAVLPENSATVLSGEILTFNLGRAFGIDEFYQPGFFHLLKGANLQKFKELVVTIAPKNPNKAENKEKVLKDIAKNPQGIKSIFKQFGTKPEDYDDLVSGNNLNKTHVFKGGSAPVSQLLSCKGPQPKSNMITANKGTTTETEAVRQISNMFLTDALVQQWDRFSGGNLQTITEGGVVKFISFDNGGTWGGESHTKKVLANVSRFDRRVAEQILELDTFLNHKKTSYHGLVTDEDFLHAFGVEQFPKILGNFKKALAATALHIRNNQNCYFE